MMAPLVPFLEHLGAFFFRPGPSLRERHEGPTLGRGIHPQWRRGTPRAPGSARDSPRAAQPKVPKVLQTTRAALQVAAGARSGRETWRILEDIFLLGKGKGHSCEDWVIDELIDDDMIGIFGRILDQFPMESVCLVVGRHVRKSAHLGYLFRAFTATPAGGGLGRRCSIEESCKGGRVKQTIKGFFQTRCCLGIWNCKLTNGLAELSFEHGHIGASVSPFSDKIQTVAYPE